MILYITLQRAIGLNLSRVLGCSSLEMRAMNVAFREGRSQCIVLDSSTTFQTSILMISQKWWKKLEVKPSGPGAFPSFSWADADSTSIRVTGRSSSWLCSSVMIFGICWRISLIASCLSIGSSWCAILKWVRSSLSMSSFFSSHYPCWF